MPDIRFLLDADMPRSAAEVFRKHGFPVADSRDSGLRGATDSAIIEHALMNGLIVVTRDTDFGEILRYPKHPGAIILRLPPTSTAPQIVERLDRLLREVRPHSFMGAITIVEVGRTRRRSIE